MTIESPVTTHEGYERLLERLQAALKAYDDICDSNSHAAQDGDTSVWHDNFAYEHNQREMHRFASMVTQIKNLLSVIKIVPVPVNPTFVQVGCIIVLRDENEGKEWVFEVAGYDDGNIEEKRISYEAPIIKEIMDKQVGDEVEILLDDQKRTVFISEIRGKEAQEHE